MRYRNIHKLARLLPLCGLFLLGASSPLAQDIPLTGYGPPLPLAAIDQGVAPGSTPIRRIHLTLNRSATQQHALSQLLDAQQDSSSASFHQWLTPAQFGTQFGPSDADLATVTAWLAAHGFTSIQPNSGRTVVEFSGSAAAVQAAFHTSIHSISLNGKTHYANRSDPQIPAALASLVGSVVSLNDLPRSAETTPAGSFRRDNKTGAITSLKAPAIAAKTATGLSPTAAFTLPSNNTTYYAITPGDFAVLYDVLPLWNAATPIDGFGQIIAIAGDTDINPADFVAFRNLFGLPLGNTSSQTGTQYLNIIYNGPQPAVKSDEYHADADTQWAAAAAKRATIDYIASESTEASSGLDLSAAYIVDNNLASILVYSYSACELTLGTSGNAFYSALWQQAAAQGITVVTPAGDSGAAGCDAFHYAPASLGKAVSGISSTPYAVSVGGTEFNAPSGLASYFKSINSSTFASVASYIPEEVWNDACTNFSIDNAAPYSGLTREQVCNSSSAISSGLVTTAGTGGGASTCVISDGVHPSTCTGGYPKPAWQSAPGVLADGLRDIPDVALFASEGRTNSFYIVCQQDRDTDGLPCNLNAPYSDFAAYGGTSIATSAFAGIMALAAQNVSLSQPGARIGNPNYVLYQLETLQAQLNSANNTSCASNGVIASTCVFHDISVGTNAMPCVTGTPDCVTSTSSDAYGILAVAAASSGYDRSTGLGSVDAAHLVNSWSSVSYQATSAVLSISPSQIVHGSPVTATVTVTSAGAPTGQVSINSLAGAGSVGSGPLVASSSGPAVFTQSFRNFPGGAYGIDAHYAGDALNAPADSNYVNLIVTPEPSSTTLQPLHFNPTTLVGTPVTSAPYGDIFYIRANVAGASGQGIATGNVAVNDNGVILGSGVYRLNSSGYTEAQNNAFAPGVHLLTATYSGDSSFDASAATPASLTITRAPTTATLTASTPTVSIGSVVTLSAVVNTTSFGYAAPTGTITFLSGNQVIGTSTVLGGTDSTSYYRNADATLTISASPLTLGSNPLTISYTGDSNYLPVVSAPAPLTVTGSTLLTTTTAVTANPSPVATTSSIVFSATVLSTAGGPVSSGTIQFIVDGQNFSVPVAVSGGLASIAVPVALLPGKPLIGFHSLYAVFSGDLKTVRSSTAVQMQFTVQAPGIVSIPAFIATPANAVQGTFISVVATVTTAATTTLIPTGTIQLVLDGGPYGSALPLINGAATLPFITSTVQVGGHVLTIYYSGDSNFAPAYALASNVVTTAAGVTASTVTLSNLAGNIAAGTSAVFTATVAPGSPSPTGIFQIILDGGNPGLPILLHGASSSLTIPSSSIPVGNHTVAVFYSGDATYRFSTSATYSFSVVNSLSNVGTFTISPTTSIVVADIAGATQSIAYTVAPSGGFQGAVAFSCSGLPSNTACVFSPATVTINSANAATTALLLQLNTGVHAASQLPPRTNPFRAPSAIAFAALLCLGMPRRLRSKLRRLPILFGVILIAALTAFTGCGSGVASGITPAGNYKVTVNATNGSNTQTATISLTITSPF